MDESRTDVPAAYHFFASPLLFRGFDEDDIYTVLECAGARTKTVKADEYILRVGDTTSEMGFVPSGSALIIREDLRGTPQYHEPRADGRYYCRDISKLQKEGVLRYDRNRFELREVVGI